jgi:hypothetical protein
MLNIPCYPVTWNDDTTEDALVSELAAAARRAVLVHPAARWFVGPAAYDSLYRRRARASMVDRITGDSTTLVGLPARLCATGSRLWRFAEMQGFDLSGTVALAVGISPGQLDAIESAPTLAGLVQQSDRMWADMLDACRQDRAPDAQQRFHAQYAGEFAPRGSGGR